MFQPPRVVQVKEEEVEQFVCLVRPRRGLAEVAPLVQVKKDDADGLTGMVPLTAAIKRPVIDLEDSTRDRSTLHRPELMPNAASASTGHHQPTERCHLNQIPSQTAANQNSPSPSRFQCSLCGKSFASKPNLRNHKYVHTEERPFACTFPGCNKAFKRKAYLPIHLRIHSNTRPFRCIWPGCEMAFYASSNLTVHTRKHTGDQPYKCSWTGCNKTFARRSLLTEHLNIHTGTRPHPCPHCPSAFIQRSNLTVHLRLHSGQLPFQCGLCSKQFNQKNYLTGHMRNKHRDHSEASNVCSDAYSTALQSTLATVHLPPMPPSSKSANFAPVQVKTETKGQINKIKKEKDSTWAVKRLPPFKCELFDTEDTDCKCSQCLQQSGDIHL